MLVVGGGDLKGVEDGAGVRARNLAALERMDYLHEGELKIGGVLDVRNAWSRQGSIEQVVKTSDSSDLGSGLGAGLVVETDVGAARSGVGFIRIVGHGISTPPVYPTRPTEMTGKARNPTRFPTLATTARVGPP